MVYWYHIMKKDSNPLKYGVVIMEFVILALLIVLLLVIIGLLIWKGGVAISIPRKRPPRDDGDGRYAITDGNSPPPKGPPPAHGPTGSPTPRPGTSPTAKKARQELVTANH